MTKIKVLYISQFPGNLDAITGGVESASINLLHGLSRRQDVEAMCVSFTNQQEKEIRLSDNVVVKYIPYTFSQLRLFDYLVSNKIKRVCKTFKPDIIHVQGVSPVLFAIGRKHRPITVITQHGIIKRESRLARGTFQKIKFALKYLIEAAYFPTFRNFVFISEDNRNLLNLRENQFSAVIPNALNASFFLTKKKPDERKDMLYVGWISERKDLLTLLNALAHLVRDRKNIHLSVIGEFKSAAYKKVILEFVETNKLSDHITFLGQCAPQKVKEKLYASRIFVLPSREENLPVSVAEALALGTIVVATRVGAIPEMIEPGKTGFLVNAGQADELSKILDDIISGTYDLNQIQDQGMEAAQKYHPDIVSSETMEFYRCVLQRIEKRKSGL